MKTSNKIMNLNLFADYTAAVPCFFPFFFSFSHTLYAFDLHFLYIFTFSHVKRLKDIITTIATYNLNVKTSYPDLIVQKVS